MATWGSWVTEYGSKRARLGYNIDQTDNGNGTITFSLGIYLETEYAVDDTSNGWSISGDWSRGSSNVSGGIHIGSGGGTQTLWALSGGHNVTKTKPGPGGSVTASFSSSLTSLWQNNSTISVSGSSTYYNPAVVPTMGTISATAGIRYATISFGASSDGGSAIDAYHIYKNGLYYDQIYSSPHTVPLGNGESASFNIYAHNGVGWSGSSNTIYASAPALPTTPGSLSANASTFGQIELSWSPSNGDGYPVSYTVRRSGVVIGSTSSTSYTDTTVAPSTSYNYTVTPSTAVGSGTLASVSTTSLGGIVHTWNGSSFVTALPKAWDGSNWVVAQARVWDGSTWKYGL